jgi:ferrochelatase
VSGAVSAPARALDPLRAGYDAVLLAGFGGPEGPDDVMPFLRNVTRGRGIPEERLVEVSHHYQALGGSSPINEQNRRLQAALAAELERRGVTIPVLWGNRNWAPYLPATIAQAHSAGQVRLLGLATSAYSSYSSCRQYREDFGMALAGMGGVDAGAGGVVAAAGGVVAAAGGVVAAAGGGSAVDSGGIGGADGSVGAVGSAGADGAAGALVGSVRIDKIRPYFDRIGFRQPFADGTIEAIRSALAAGLEIADVEIVFTTHSIPLTMAATSGSASLGDHRPGGAYVTQHLAVAEAVVAQVFAEFGVAPSWQLAYQSRSGPPSVPWLDPDINDVIDNLAGGGRRGVIVVPIGFVSDHVEVVWDLDNEAAETADKHGLFFARVRTPGTDPRFVAELADLVQERLGDAVATSAPLAGAARRPDFCAAGCCVNSRVTRPTTAAEDSGADWAGLDFDPARLIASGIRGLPTDPVAALPTAG